MSNPLLPIGDGHTELTDDDRHGLIPTYITTRGELFDAEQRNIAKALLRRAPDVDRLLDDTYLRNLHRAMFEDVWDWAGRYRLRETNLGIDPNQIAPAVRGLVQDAKAWVELGTYEPDEASIRFHHRLVSIHPFPNGNGRHGRIAADYLVTALGQERFSWGSKPQDIELTRQVYRESLQQADGGDLAALIDFARS